MKKRSILTIEVDSQGRLVIPAALGKRYGFAAGTQVRVEEDANGLRLSRSSGNLARVYVEVTNQCNLDCVTCMRNVWDEAPGRMSEAVFQRVLEGVRAVQPAPGVFFGGYGEPLTHPQICDWVAQARQAGAAVELITNGILLTKEISQRLIDAGLERIWVSLDGATPESYEDVRLGAALPVVIENLRQLKALRAATGAIRPYLGIACVVMKRNIRDLPELVRLGKSLGADQFSVTNVLAHTPELRDEMLYCRSSSEGKMTPSISSPLIRLPRIDINALTGESLLELMQSPHILAVNRQDVQAGGSTCPFVEKGSVSVRWDGAVSPCLALLHNHASYLDHAAAESCRAGGSASQATGSAGLASESSGRLRRSLAYTVGSLQEHSLLDLWNLTSYRELRERLLAFDFSPCITCNSCEMANSNEEDCFGNTQPTCGGCLWGQGFIQCP
jgi:MoaA/NifB/PqqE/SkfB family radical SAM enzyme